MISLCWQELSELSSWGSDVEAKKPDLNSDFLMANPRFFFSLQDYSLVLSSPSKTTRATTKNYASAAPTEPPFRSSEPSTVGNCPVLKCVRSLAPCGWPRTWWPLLPCPLCQLSQKTSVVIHPNPSRWDIFTPILNLVLLLGCLAKDAS